MSLKISFCFVWLHKQPAFNWNSLKHQVWRFDVKDHSVKQGQPTTSVENFHQQFSKIILDPIIMMFNETLLELTQLFCQKLTLVRGKTMFDNVGLMFTSIFINTSKYRRKMKNKGSIEDGKAIKILAFLLNIDLGFWTKKTIFINSLRSFSFST